MLSRSPFRARRSFAGHSGHMCTFEVSDRDSEALVGIRGRALLGTAALGVSLEGTFQLFQRGQGECGGVSFLDVYRPLQQFTETLHDGILGFFDTLWKLFSGYVDETCVGKKAPNPLFLGFSVHTATLRSYNEFTCNDKARLSQDRTVSCGLA